MAMAWDQEEPNTLWIGHRDRPNELLIKDPSLLRQEARPYAHYPGGHPEGYPDGPKNLFLQFYEFIRSGRDPRSGSIPFPTFEDGHWANKIVEAVLTSTRTRQWVDVR
jgi:predicted dehydrogenase